MNLFEKNINAIEQEGFRKLLKEANKAEDDIEVGTDYIDGKPVLYAIMEEKLYQLDSMYTTEKYLENWIKYIKPEWNSKFIVFGLGNGMFVRELLKIADKYSIIIVYEPSIPLLLEALKNYDMSDILSERRVVLYTELQKEYMIFHDLLCNYVTYSDLYSLKIINYPNYDILFKEEYDKFRKLISEAANTISTNYGTFSYFGEGFAINSLYNAEKLIRGKKIESLKTYISPNTTGIVVSCGPSLNKNIDELKQAKGKSIIVAADSAVKVLLAHGIVPDFFATLDPNKPLEIFEGEEINSIPVVCSSDCNHGAIRNHKGPYFFGRSGNVYINEFFDENNISIDSIPTGGSVANDCFGFLCMIGVKKIILVGQDLAYTGEKFYADDSVGATWDMQEEMDKDVEYVEDIEGGLVRSSQLFVQYRLWFERAIEQGKDVLEVVNATEGGARMHGAIEMTLREAIDKYCMEEIDVKDIIIKASPIFNDTQKIAFRDYIDDLPNRLSIVREQLKSGISVYEKMQNMIETGRYRGEAFKKLFDEADIITKDIDKDTSLIFAEGMVHNDMKEIAIESAKTLVDEKEELMAAVDIGTRKYELLIKGVDIFMKYLERINGGEVIYGAIKEF